jgi:signal transduction histidine kinase
MTTPVPASGWRRTLAWGLCVVSILLIMPGVVYFGVRLVTGSASWARVLGNLGLAPPAVAFAVVGLVVTLRRSNNPAGWLMLSIGLLWSMAQFPPLGGGGIPVGGSAIWVVPFGLMATHLLLRLPDGSLLSPRWRWVSRLSTLGILLGSLIPTREHDPSLLPFAVLGLAGLALILACAVASIVSLVLRARRGSDEQRHQIRWVAAGAGVFLALYLLSFVPSILGASDTSIIVALGEFMTGVGYAAIPISIGVAILRYRLYDIDVVIRKVVVLGAMVVFFVLVYALIVGGVGALIASSGNTALSFAAAAIVAILFQPVLTRTRRFADRVVYGKRATPYEVLSEFGDHLAETYAADEVLPRIARVLAEGVGAERADVWLSDGTELRSVATWPTGSGPSSADDHRVEVRHQGELLGALSVITPANDPMDPTKEKLISDLAAQAGLVLRNVRLIEELRASRQRLVAAQDEERRKIERNIHDGVQQQLVALAVQLRLLEQSVDRDPAAAKKTASGLQEATTQALEDLRDLARGIYPPLLADKGLAAALEAQGRKAPVPVSVEAGDVGRYPADVEATVYFCALEALNNVAKYADASSVEIGISQRGGHLRFSVKDDGVGFDPATTGYGTGLQGMADRLDSVGGSIEVESAPGQGTTVSGSLPVHTSDTTGDVGTGTIAASTV